MQGKEEVVAALERLAAELHAIQTNRANIQAVSMAALADTQYHPNLSKHYFRQATAALNRELAADQEQINFKKPNAKSS